MTEESEARKLAWEAEHNAIIPIGGSGSSGPSYDPDAVPF
mgnify:CR=1 FL=1